jgi:chromosome segregation ATPase
MYKGFIITLIFVILGWGITAWHLNGKNRELKNLNINLESKFEQKQKESANYEAALSLQNTQIKQFELDVQSAKTTLQNTNKEIERKYKNIKAASDTCETKLEAIREITEAFYAKGD